MASSSSFYFSEWVGLWRGGEGREVRPEGVASAGGVEEHARKLRITPVFSIRIRISALPNIDSSLPTN
jgi:hypothetical protein